jgi:3-phosphoshikimate 1-carboxyvinyltransferase
MRVLVKKSKAGGSVAAPASKSFTHRAVILASLAKGRSRISNLLVSDDTLLTIDACRKLGAGISLAGSEAVIDGFDGHPTPLAGSPIFLGNSGTSMRLLASVAALSRTPVILDGDDRMRKRPIADLLDALDEAGFRARAINGDGCPPVEVWSDGKGMKDTIRVRATTSSQFVSSLLLVAPIFGRKTTIEIEGAAKSKPYIAITLGMMRRFGATVENSGFSSFEVGPIRHYTSRDYRVEADYSSAAYFFAAAAITAGRVTVTGLEADSIQADAQFLTIMEGMGTTVSRKPGAITVSSDGNLTGAGQVDCSDFPDAVPTICVVAACASGVTKIVNVGHLHAKESDRITDLVAELKKFGCDASEGADFIEVRGRGTRALHGATVNTHNDHRLAMAFAVLGMAVGKTTVLGAECVSKSFPDFFERLESVSAKLQRQDYANIVLIGFMGTGKSEVARQISRLTGMPLAELDAEIERSAGMKIREIFKAEGEAGFCKREAIECERASKLQGCVISCGGGIVLDKRNVALLKQAGKLYLLKASPEVIWQRVSADVASRPRLAPGGIDRVRQLLSAREKLYESSADFRVDTTGKSVAEIAEKVLRLHASNKTVKCAE